MNITDGADLLAAPLQPIAWAVQDLLPMGTVGDLAGPPGEGKSTLVLDLAIAIAHGSGHWYGRPCISGRVVLLGGERGSDATLARDLHRISQGRSLEQDRLLVPSSLNNEQPPIWHWTSTGWVHTEWGIEVTRWLKIVEPALVVLDTQMAVASGTNQLDNAQQYAFGTELQRWSRQFGSPVVLSISHTNQASSSQNLAWRLHYLSRAGGNGLPGALRWAAGLSRLRPDDILAKALDMEEDATHRWLIAFGISKSNEMPRPPWTPDTPALFELRPDGSLALLDTTTRAGSAKPQQKPVAQPGVLPKSEGCPPELRHVPDWL